MDDHPPPSGEPTFAHEEFKEVAPRLPQSPFVTGPFLECPDCQLARFGRLTVTSRAVVNRCVDCGFTGRRQLPALSKKVVYLDQMAISNMMKAIHPERSVPTDDRWRRLFEKLDRLVKMQLIVCPESPIHERESLASPFFEELQRMYELLSVGVSFREPALVGEIQVARQAPRWLAGTAAAGLPLEPTDVLTVPKDEWTEPMQIKVRFAIEPDEVSTIREGRDLGGDLLEGVFEHWQAEAGRSRDEWYRDEVYGWSRTTWHDYLARTGRFLDAAAGARPFNEEDINPPTRSREAMIRIRRALSGAGVEDQDLLAATFEFLFSDAIPGVPKLHIEASMWSEMAHQAGHGRRRAPGRGAMNDVSVIAAFLPYCDAMLIDREMRGLLAAGPVASRIGFDTRLFTSKTIDDLTAFLDDVESQASPAVLAAVESVYGAPTPFTEMYCA